MDPLIDTNRATSIIVVAGVLLTLLGAGAPAVAALAPTDTLVLVNGDPITVREFDKLVMESHREFKEGSQGVGMADQILQKRIKDYLIIQDALAAGYDEEPALQEMMEDNRREYAIQSYVKDNVDLPAAADPDSVRTHFERYYWRIQFRSLAMRTLDETAAARKQVEDGADMAAMAEEVSLDTRRLQGGLWSLLVWGDVPNVLRENLRGLDVDDLSEIFAYNDAFMFVRVEQILPVDEDAFGSVENKISSIVHSEARQRVWDAWIAEQEALANVSEHLEAFAEMIADSAFVTTGEYLKEQPGVAIEIPDGPSISGTKMRRTISHEAMQNALAPFNHHLTEARRILKAELVLGYLAERQGYFEDPTVVERLEKDWERSMIERYLSDSVTSKIRFNREEFQEFYDENKEGLRGPDEVRVDLMFFQEEEKAAEALQRLREGADFGYVYELYNPGKKISVGQANFIRIPDMSPKFQEQLEGMEVGGYSEVMDMPMGLMIFRLDAKRPGAIPALEAVEMEIRRVMYQRKFNELLDAHMEILREAAEIEYYSDRIAKYHEPVREGR